MRDGAASTMVLHVGMMLLAGVSGCARAGAAPGGNGDATAPVAGGDAGSTGSERLAALRDRSRVLVVFAPNARDPRLQEQDRLWAGSAERFADRDLVRLLVVEEPPDRELSRRFAIAQGTFAVVLVGKDGHQAFRSEQPVPAEEVCARIDAMPMRREELRRRGR